MGKYVKEIECFLGCEFFYDSLYFWQISFYSLQLIYPISAWKFMNGVQCEYLNYLRKRRWRRNIFCSRYGSLDVLLSQSHSYVPEYDCNSKLVFIGPESDHWLPLSLTIKLADSMSFSRLDWCYPCEDSNLKLFEVVTVADVDAENCVDGSLVQMWKRMFGQLLSCLKSLRPNFAQNMLSWVNVGLANSFGALLVGWLVVLARGLYLARHIFTLSK